VVEASVRKMRVPKRFRFERDANILIVSVGIASLSGGFAGVVQPIYLNMIGISPALIGVIASVSIVASSLRIGFVRSSGG